MSPDASVQNETSSADLGALLGTCPLPLSDYHAALARPDDPADVAVGLKHYGAVRGSMTTPGYNSMVHRYGAASGGPADGTLIIKHLSVLIPYASGRALFVDQYGIMSTSTSTPFAIGGDSGALVIAPPEYGGPYPAVGLLFARAGTSPLCYANPIDPILKKFALDPA